MGGCMSLEGGGPAARGRDPGLFHSRSPLPPPPMPLPATFPEDEPVVKQVLPDTRRRPLSPLPANDEQVDCPPDSPMKVKATADHGVLDRKSISGGYSPPFVAAVRSASAREYPGDRFGRQQLQPEMMKMTLPGGDGMMGRRTKSLRDTPLPSGEGPFHTEADKHQQLRKSAAAAAPGKETLENPLVSLECFIFL